MEQPTFVFKQGDLLKGMTSSLRAGACWGLTVKWLRDCYSGGPSVAGLGITHGTTAHEALIDHANRANQFLSGSSDDSNLSNGIVMLSLGRLDGVRDTNADANIGAGAGMLSLRKAMSITAALTSVDGNYFGMIVFACPIGRHAMAVTKCRNVWALFDPNYGTWTYAGDASGAPPKFPALLKDNFDSYKVTEVKLLKITRLINE
ncbi:hypothetical protein LMG28727_05333 [Paraburkholderia kirstenboschensis]|uniref:YopT-type cysteine protease domain-containing protein n=1 Tax=Paraburkholderia kirstenboschensis TaxID=1245436 RepID=UPI000ABCFC80|nr:YopT-type cysteine protease domain-containing protein [Paraburkholderia kirstenboschensis]CAD6552065.1 hypothetical protein LMG28727_05333 [Paraburkholderia kirstenboschensis]